MARWPEQTDRVLSALSPALPGLFAPTLRAGLLAGVVSCLALATVDAFRVGERGAAAEGLLLAALFFSAPPLAAFGAYFGGWHAVRHITRLLPLDPRNADDLAAGRLRPALRRYAVAAAGPTLIAGAGIALLVHAAAAHEWAAPALAVLLGLTAPHLVVVALMDRRAARA